MPLESEQSNQQINRWLVAIIAIICLAAGISIAIFDSYENFWCGGFIRVGVLMTVFWFCLPANGRPAAWANFNPWWLVGFAAALLVVKQTRIIVAMSVVLAVIGVILPMFTRPRK